jgi:hypothetical protein
MSACDELPDDADTAEMILQTNRDRADAKAAITPCP